MSMKETYDHMLYPSYKPTGIPWLGDVPDHWATERLKQHVDDVNEQTRERLSQDIYIALENVEGWTGKITAAENEVSFDSQVKRFRVGDVLFGKLRPYLAKVAAPNRKGLCVGEFLVLRSQQDSLSPDYLEQLLRSKGVIDTVDASTFGAKMPRADWNFIGSMLFPIPPMDEQDAIVRYLDDADQRIRAYVSVKERLIALLEEERQAVIHQAVTKGLDPNVKLKPSGVEWLGEVPDHWEVRRVRTLGQAIIGLTYSPQDMTDAGEGKLVLRASNISGGRVVDADNVYVRCPVPDKLILREGDILICSRSGSRNLIGKNARIANTPLGVTFGAFMTILRGPNNDYLHQVFNSKLFEYQSGAFLTSTINQLTLGILNDMKIPFPPAGEQQSILQYLNEATQAVDATINRARRQIELMGEYRTRLIADVVTGKIDVREAKP